MHVLKSEPDEIIKRLMGPMPEGSELDQFELYTGDVDYDELVKQVFEHDKVICWW